MKFLAASPVEPSCCIALGMLALLEHEGPAALLVRFYVFGWS